jgi:hypothetical protein
MVMAACSSPPATRSTSSLNSTDREICGKITKAAASYKAKDFSAWRTGMAQIGAIADSAKNPSIRTYAAALRAAYVTTTSGVQTPSNGYQNLFLGVGAYSKLKSVCAGLDE